MEMVWWLVTTTPWFTKMGHTAAPTTYREATSGKYMQNAEISLLGKEETFKLFQTTALNVRKLSKPNEIYKY